MIELMMVLVAAGGIGAGYVKVRQFVRGRLRFVDSVQRRGTPYLAGALAAVVVSPVVWLLPVLGGGTALLFGAGVGLGVAHGARDVRVAGYLPGSY